jgi:beta-phosphoglucomutase family hydrolase
METWPKISLNSIKDYNMCFGCGKDNPFGLKLKFTWDGKTATAEFVPGENHQGWSGYVHGGILLCLLDEAMGYAATYGGGYNVTAKIQARLKHMAAVGEPLVVTCSVAKKNKRLIETEASLTLKDGTVVAEGSSIQYLVNPEKERSQHDETALQKAVIWDMDGIIADTRLGHFKSWQYVFRKKGTVYTDEDSRRNFGRRNDAIIHDILGESISDEELKAIGFEKEDYFRRNAKDSIIAFPGVLKLLSELKSNGFAAAVASSAPLENVRLILSALGITDKFRTIVSGEDVTEGKPHPQVFLLAAEKLGVKPECCIVIEDAIAGVAAAKSAGMRCIAVTNTHPAEKLRQADLIVASLEQVDIAELNKLLNKKTKDRIE